jgi:hypothetical protein
MKKTFALLAALAATILGFSAGTIRFDIEHIN